MSENVFKRYLLFKVFLNELIKEITAKNLC